MLLYLVTTILKYTVVRSKMNLLPLYCSVSTERKTKIDFDWNYIKVYVHGGLFREMSHFLKLSVWLKVKTNNFSTVFSVVNIKDSFGIL